jgi:hypothetical protein
MERYSITILRNFITNLEEKLKKLPPLGRKQAFKEHLNTETDSHYRAYQELTKFIELLSCFKELKSITKEEIINYNKKSNDSFKHISSSFLDLVNKYTEEEGIGSIIVDSEQKEVLPNSTTNLSPFLQHYHETVENVAQNAKELNRFVGDYCLVTTSLIDIEVNGKKEQEEGILIKGLRIEENGNYFEVTIFGGKIGSHKGVAYAISDSYVILDVLNYDIKGNRLSNTNYKSSLAFSLPPKNIRAETPTFLHGQELLVSESLCTYSRIFILVKNENPVSEETFRRVRFNDIENEKNDAIRHAASYLHLLHQNRLEALNKDENKVVKAQFSNNWSIDDFTKEIEQLKTYEYLNIFRNNISINLSFIENMIGSYHYISIRNEKTQNKKENNFIIKNIYIKKNGLVFGKDESYEYIGFISKNKNDELFIKIINTKNKQLNFSNDIAILKKEKRYLENIFICIELLTDWDSHPTARVVVLQKVEHDETLLQPQTLPFEHVEKNRTNYSPGLQKAFSYLLKRRDEGTHKIRVKSEDNEYIHLPPQRLSPSEAKDKRVEIHVEKHLRRLREQYGRHLTRINRLYQGNYKLILISNDSYKNDNLTFIIKNLNIENNAVTLHDYNRDNPKECYIFEGLLKLNRHRVMISLLSAQTLKEEDETKEYIKWQINLTFEINENNPDNIVGVELSADRNSQPTSRIFCMIKTVEEEKFSPYAINESQIEEQKEGTFKNALQYLKTLYYQNKYFLKVEGANTPIYKQRMNYLGKYYLGTYYSNIFKRQIPLFLKNEGDRVELIGKKYHYKGFFTETNDENFIHLKLFTTQESSPLFIFTYIDEEGTNNSKNGTVYCFTARAYFEDGSKIEELTLVFFETDSNHYEDCLKRHIHSTETNVYLTEREQEIAQQIFDQDFTRRQGKRTHFDRQDLEMAAKNPDTMEKFIAEMFPVILNYNLKE